MRDQHRVTFFIPSLDGGGAERVVVNLVNGFFALGKSVDLLLFHRCGVYLDQVAEGVQIESLRAPKSWMRALTVQRFVGYLRRSKSATLVVSGHSAFLIAWLGHFLSSVRLVVIVHNTVSRERRLSRWIARCFYRFANEVVAVSEGVARDLEKYANVSPHRLRTIYNPIDPSRIIAESQVRADHPWFEDPGVRVLVSVGSLTEQKNFPLLLRALRKARDKDSRLKLIILGEGGKRDSLQELALDLGLQDVVSMPGFVRNPYSYMRSAYRFVLPSNFEGFGMVLVEALCSGARVISTDCPSGPSEILGNGRWGVLVPPDDVEQMAEALLLDNAGFPEPAESRQRSRDYALAGALEAYAKVIHV